MEKYQKIKAVMPEIKEPALLRYAQTAFISSDYFIDFLNVHALRPLGTMKFLAAFPAYLAQGLATCIPLSNYHINYLLHA